MSEECPTTKKWFGTSEYQTALKLFSVVKQEMPNPTYRQVEQVLKCMKDLAKDGSVFSAKVEK